MGPDVCPLTVVSKFSSTSVSCKFCGVGRQDFDERGLQAVVRASVHYYNTEEEIRALVASVAAAR